jgi:nucleotide-binding universal stress UspA family protein
MNQSIPSAPSVPSTTDETYSILDNVFHPSDFSAESLVAFHHALKAALVAKCKLTLLHVSPDVTPDWTHFPGVRDTLERWGLIPPGSPRSAVPQLGIDVRKAITRDSSPLKGILHYFETHQADLIVLATHSHEGRASWLRQSIAEPITRRAGQMTLFLPEGVAGFVSAENGSVSLEQILIPVASSPLPQQAVAAAARLVTRLGCPHGTFTILHVGDAGAMPMVDCPEVAGWEWNKVTRTGEIVPNILGVANEEKTDMIVMSTRGHHGFLDALRGSHSERVLHSAPCPLLTIPEGSHAAAALVA